MPLRLDSDWMLDGSSDVSSASRGDAPEFADVKEAARFKRNIRTRGRGRAGSAWSEHHEAASFVILEDSSLQSNVRAVSPSSRSLTSREARELERAARWDDVEHGETYDFECLAELYAATNVKGRIWCMLFYKPGDPRSDVAAELFAQVADDCARPFMTGGLRNIQFGTVREEVLSNDGHADLLYMTRSIVDLPVIKYFRRAASKVALRGHGEAFTSPTCTVQSLTGWLREMNALSLVSDGARATDDDGAPTTAGKPKAKPGGMFFGGGGGDVAPLTTKASPALRRNGSLVLAPGAVARRNRAIASMTYHGGPWRPGGTRPRLAPPVPLN